MTRTRTFKEIRESVQEIMKREPTKEQLAELSEVLGVMARRLELHELANPDCPQCTEKDSDDS